MPVEKITEKILADARAEAERIIEQARAEAAEICEKSEEKISGEVEHILEQARSDARDVIARRRAILDLELRKNMLASKRAVLEETYEQAKRNILKNPDSYRQFLYNMLLECARMGDGTLLVSASDGSMITQKMLEDVLREMALLGLTRNIELEKGHEEIANGFIYRLSQMDINCSMGAVFRRVQDQTEAGVSKILFSE